MRYRSTTIIDNQTEDTINISRPQGSDSVRGVRSKISAISEDYYARLDLLDIKPIIQIYI